MKIIGLLGGMSWESTAVYYRLINEGIRASEGGLRSARCVLWSVDFAPLEELQRAGRWDEIEAILVDAGRRLQAAGASFLVLCTNTMHRVADPLEQALDIELLHIADVAALEARGRGLRRVGLLGTRFTMEQRFYQERLSNHGLEVLIPDPPQRAVVHRVIYEELCRGRLEGDSRRAIEDIIHDLASRGAEGVILGCTELPMLLDLDALQIPALDTTQLHAAAAIARSLT
ncbi:MAG TPA: aspartate/glutamate racemase family protein [Deltaproteobacteria bacterium]|nr:aspartate/glutamate racemase family protein [Deltaproteobacteria bacterium]